MSNMLTEYSIKSSVKIFILSFCLFLISLLISINTFDGEIGVYISIMFGIVSFFILDKASLYLSLVKEKNKTELTISSLTNEIESFSEIITADKVHSYGSILDATNILAKKMSNADWVMNIFAGVYLEENDKDVRKLIVNSYENWLENPSKGKWEDLIGVPELFSKRYEEIRVKEQIGEHQIHLLRHSMPLLNFVILGKGKRSEAIWGWLPKYQNDPRQYKIYSTKDPKAVRVFKEYFEYLRDNKCWNGSSDHFSLDFSKKSLSERYANVDVVNKKGTWRTLGLSGSTKQNLSVHTLGFISFLIDNSRIEVNPVIFDAVSFRKFEEAEAEHLEISHYQNEVYAGYELQNQTSGIVHYRFCKKRNGQEYLVGTYIDKETGKRKSLVGMRECNMKIEEALALTPTEVEAIIRETTDMFDQAGVLEHFLGPKYR